MRRQLHIFALANSLLLFRQNQRGVFPVGLGQPRGFDHAVIVRGAVADARVAGI